MALSALRWRGDRETRREGAGQTMIIFSKGLKTWVLTDKRTGRKVESFDLVIAVRDLVDPDNPWFPDDHFEKTRVLEFGADR